MTQILNTHREKRKRIFLSLFFLQTNENKTSIGGYFTCKSDILHIYSILVPRETNENKTSIGGYFTCKSDILHIYSILVPRASLGPEHEDEEALGTQD